MPFAQEVAPEAFKVATPESDQHSATLNICRDSEIATRIIPGSLAEIKTAADFLVADIPICRWPSPEHNYIIASVDYQTSAYSAISLALQAY